VVRIHLPPLRARRDDIPLLARSFVEEFARENGKPDLALTPEAIHLLEGYDWPGNVRELRNCIESMVVLARGLSLGTRDLPPSVRGASAEPERLEPVALNLKAAERDLMVRALEQSGGNKARAARLLGISRRTLYRKLDEYGISR